MESVFEICQEPNDIARKYMRKHPLQYAISKGQKKFTFSFSTSDDWVNFANSHMYMKVKIVKAVDGSAFADEDTFSVINILGHSFIKQLDFYAQNKHILTHDRLDYRAYFDNMLTHNNNALKSWCQTSLNFPDQHMNFDKLSADNKGFAARQQYVKSSRVCETITTPSCFPFNCDKLLPPGIVYRIEIIRNPDEFLLLCEAALGATIEIVEMYLMIEHVIPTIETISKANQLFLSGKPALYPFEQSVVETFQITRGATHVELPSNLTRPSKPRLLLLAMASEKAFDGNVTLNPYRFQHFNLKKCQINVAGTRVWPDGLNFDWDAKTYLESYHELQKTLQYFNSDDGMSISRTGYDNGYFIIGCNLDDCVDSTSAQPMNVGDSVISNDLSVILDFASPLTENVRVICYCVYSNLCVVKHVKTAGDGVNATKDVSLNGKLLQSM